MFVWEDVNASVRRMMIGLGALVPDETNSCQHACDSARLRMPDVMGRPSPAVKLLTGPENKPRIFAWIYPFAMATGYQQRRAGAKRKLLQ
jgi:hypothetical protein